MGLSAEMDKVSFPKMEGHLDFDIEFAHEPTETYTMVMISEYKNQYNLSVPTFEAIRDW